MKVEELGKAFRQDVKDPVIACIRGSVIENGQNKRR